MQFLSYAAEDAEVGRYVAERLRDAGIPVFDWQDPQQLGDRFIPKIEQQISQANGFLALLSPSFLASPWCNQERELALQRAADLQASGKTGSFVHVLKVRDTFVSEAGVLHNWDILDLTDADTRDSVLMSLVGKLSLADPADNSGAGVASHTTAAPIFRNRQVEMESVVRGLTNAGGPHFWLVSAPPKLGKTWFLSRLASGVTAAQSSRWTARLVDLRQHPSEMRDDAAAILGALFDLTQMTTERDALRRCAQAVTERKKSHLCLLDSAELLTEGVARTLRSCLAQIYDLAQRAGDVDLRLGLVVASRHESRWRGVTPSPRLSMVTLTGFDVHIVEEALRDLSYQTHRSFEAATYRRHAVEVHSLSQGLPALVVQCLHWIRGKQWLGIDEIEAPEIFAEISRPYIEEVLLSDSGLFPSEVKPQTESGRALKLALRALVRYRIITQSHLRYHIDSDQEFGRLLSYLGWSVEDLWAAISSTALLKSPLNEPWQEVHQAIRRLLYRYYYPTEEQRAEAHREAYTFVEVWADNQSGKEQVVGMVECLWHTSEMLRLTQSSEGREILDELSAKLSQALRPSAAYTIPELQEYAISRIYDDVELQESIQGLPGLQDELTEIIAKTRGGPQHE